LRFQIALEQVGDSFDCEFEGRTGLAIRSLPPLRMLWARLSKSLWVVTKMNGVR
jgi:hypothetical protein